MAPTRQSYLTSPPYFHRDHLSVFRTFDFGLAASDRGSGDGASRLMTLQQVRAEIPFSRCRRQSMTRALRIFGLSVARFGQGEVADKPIAVPNVSITNASAAARTAPARTEPHSTKHAPAFATCSTTEPDLHVNGVSHGIFSHFKISGSRAG
jgi:hypothetical protein